MYVEAISRCSIKKLGFANNPKSGYTSNINEGVNGAAAWSDGGNGGRYPGLSRARQQKLVPRAFLTYFQSIHLPRYQIPLIASLTIPPNQEKGGKSPISHVYCLPGPYVLLN